MSLGHHRRCVGRLARVSDRSIGISAGVGCTLDLFRFDWFKPAVFHRRIKWWGYADEYVRPVNFGDRFIGILVGVGCTLDLLLSVRSNPAAFHLWVQWWCGTEEFVRRIIVCC